jgi:hypothetical protein
MRTKAVVVAGSSLGTTKFVAVVLCYGIRT